MSEGTKRNISVVKDADGNKIVVMYRYDTRFALPIYDDCGELDRYNIFTGRLLIRHASSGKKYLYDVLEIKRETSNPFSDNSLPDKKPIS